MSVSSEPFRDQCDWVVGNWKFNAENDAFQLDLDRVIRDMTTNMMALEEEARLHVVVEFLRAKGWTLIPPESSVTGAEKKNEEPSG